MSFIDLGSSAAAIKEALYLDALLIDEGRSSSSYSSSSKGRRRSPRLLKRYANLIVEAVEALTLSKKKASGWKNNQFSQRQAKMTSGEKNNQLPKKRARMTSGEENMELPKKRAKKTSSENNMETQGVNAVNAQPLSFNELLPGAPKVLAPRNNLSFGLCYKLDLKKLTRNQRIALKECATLAMKDHALQLSYALGLNFLKLKEVTCIEVDGYKYIITFEAYSKIYGVRTFEADVWDGIDERQVNQVRTISPIIGEWLTGKLYLPKI